jgi:Peptidase M1 N-terminal domain
LKAIFEVEITADESLTVLSNMDVNAETVSKGKKTTIFNPTPKMSTYVSPWFDMLMSYLRFVSVTLDISKRGPRVEFLCVSTLLVGWKRTANLLLTWQPRRSTSSARNLARRIPSPKWTWYVPANIILR